MTVSYATFLRGRQKTRGHNCLPTGVTDGSQKAKPKKDNIGAREGIRGHEAYLGIISNSCLDSALARKGRRDPRSPVLVSKSPYARDCARDQETQNRAQISSFFIRCAAVGDGGGV